MNKSEVMEKIAQQIEKCQKCDLYKEALKAVPGEGNISADLVFVGEAPGATEDKTGRPFVGRAGSLLEELLGEIGMKREDVWIGNIIKHRPPNNREPQPDEISACQSYLTVQLRTIKPKLVVTLGRFAMYYFYKAGRISRDHGNLITADEGFRVFPVYHPAAGLRNGNMKTALREDFLRIPQLLKQLEFDHQVQSFSNEEEGQFKLNL